MISFFKPKHTLISVAEEIARGLEDSTIYLNDSQLEKAGFVVHEFPEHRFQWEAPLTLCFSAVLSVVITVAAFESWESWRKLYFTLPAILIQLIFVYFGTYRRRVITKGSSGHETTRGK